MATTVGQHSVAAFTSPVNGTTPIDANSVRGNDNTVRSAYVDHDADPGIHVQSSTLASRPTAGTAGRKWITEDSGVYTLWFDDGTNWHPVSSENVALTVLATETLVKGDVVKVTGWNNGQDLPEVAKVASTSDVAFAIITANVANGAMGYATNTGIIQDLATNGFSVGAILYPNSSGWFTATKPTSGTYQAAAYVLRSNANNGVLYVEFSAPRIVERSDNTASTIVLRDASGNFSAGTITAGALTSTGLVTFASLKGTGATTVTNILDEDNMASDSATALATQQSIKAYVDAQVATVDTLAEVLANGNTTGANDIIVSTGQKIRTPAIAAGDGTASATIANSTGVMTIASSVLTTTDINGGTIDGTTIGGSSAAAGTFTTVGATTGNITTVNATTVDTTTIEVTNVKAKDGTASIAIADSTGVATISAAPVLSALTASQAVFTDGSKGLVSNAITGTGSVVMSASPTLTGTVTAATLNATTLGGTLSTAAQGNITSVGTLTSLTVSGQANLATTSGTVGIGATSSAKLNVQVAAAGMSGRFTDATNSTLQIDHPSSGTLRFRNGADTAWLTENGGNVSLPGALTVSGDLTVDTSTLKVDSANNRVGVNTTTPNDAFQVVGTSVFGADGGYVGTGSPKAVFYGDNNTETSTLWFQGGVGSAQAGLKANDSAFYITNTYAGNALGTNGIKLDQSGNLAVDTDTLYVDATNNRVGIGTATPVPYSSTYVALIVDGGSNASSVQLNNTTTGSGTNSGGLMLLQTGNDSYVWNPKNSFMSFGTNNTERMRLDASGNLGLGHTSSFGKLSINSNGAPATSGNMSTGLTVSNGTGGTAINIGTNDAGGYSYLQSAYVNSAGTARALAFFTGATQAMTLDASGSLQVGGTTLKASYPGYKTIEIDGSTGSLLSLNSNTTNKFQMYTNGSQTNLVNIASEPMTFHTNTTERARITSGGYLKANPSGTYIGSTSAYHEFSGDSASQYIFRVFNDGNDANRLGMVIQCGADNAGGTNYALVFDDGDGTRQGEITFSGGTTTYGTSSDYRLKDNVRPIDNAIVRLAQLKPCKWEWKRNGQESEGFVAHELQEVVPIAVAGEKDAVDEEGNPIYQSVGAANIVPLLTAALQEAMARIESLEARLAALES